MVKGKVRKEPKHTKSHIEARMNYLQHAASYLQNIATQHRNHTASSKTSRISDEILDQSTSQAQQVVNSEENAKFALMGQQCTKRSLANLSRAYLSQMRAVSLKTQTRLPVPVKRSICKRCDTLLTQGVNCKREIRNSSRGQQKPWADVLVDRCLVCGTEKHFPLTDKRSPKLTERKVQPSKHKPLADHQEQTVNS